MPHPSPGQGRRLMGLRRIALNNNISYLNLILVALHLNVNEQTCSFGPNGDFRENCLLYFRIYDRMTSPGIKDGPPGDAVIVPDTEQRYTVCRRPLFCGACNQGTPAVRQMTDTHRENPGPGSGAGARLFLQKKADRPPSGSVSFSFYALYCSFSSEKARPVNALYSARKLCSSISSPASRSSPLRKERRI